LVASPLNSQPKGIHAELVQQQTGSLFFVNQHRSDSTRIAPFLFLAACGKSARLGRNFGLPYACRGPNGSFKNTKGNIMNTYAYERITERIITLLEQGTIPWHKPWKASTGLPRNLVTKKPYRGINAFLLHAASYESPFWLTFRQVKMLGGTVRKGEKSCPVVFWKQMQLVDKQSGEERQIGLLRLYHVFNVAQCDNLKQSQAAVEIEGAPTGPADMIANMPHPPTIKHGMAHAFYSPAEDCVGMPVKERFKSEDHYYSTLFHELIHSTGHQSRLKRPAITERKGFGSDPYCKEELVAEMGAAFLCGQAEIVERTIDSSAAYLNGRLERLQHDKTLIVQAAGQAQKAADFILGNYPIESEASGVEAVAQPEPTEVAA
jgi:antirestriction protein ArdC